MMQTTLEIWDKLVAEIAELKLFKTVAAYPLNRISGAQFLKDLEAMTHPACLIVWRGRNDSIDVQARERNGQWAAIISDYDAGGDAYRNVVKILDDFTDKVLDKTLYNGAVWIKGAHSVDSEYSGPRMAVYSVLFTSTQLSNRSGQT